MNRHVYQENVSVQIVGKCYKGPGRASDDDVTSNTNCADGGSGSAAAAGAKCGVRANCEATTTAR